MKDDALPEHGSPKSVEPTNGEAATVITPYGRKVPFGMTLRQALDDEYTCQFWVMMLIYFKNQHIYIYILHSVSKSSISTKTGHCVFIKTGMTWGELPIWPCFGLGIITICVVHVVFWLLPSLKFNLRRAAKERIRRMVAPKSRRKELNAPEHLKEEWAKGDKDALSDLLTNLNFNKDWCLRNTFPFPAV